MLFTMSKITAHPHTQVGFLPTVQEGDCIPIFTSEIFISKLIIATGITNNNLYVFFSISWHHAPT